MYVGKSINLISIIVDINKVDDSEINQLNMSCSQTETCVFCNKQFRKQKKLINHIKLVHDSQTETCILCEEKLKETEKSMKHVKCVHCKELGDVGECKICHKKYKKQKKLVKHIKKVHKRKEEEVEDLREESKKADIDGVEKNLDLGGMEKSNNNLAMNEDSAIIVETCTTCEKRFSNSENKFECNGPS